MNSDLKGAKNNVIAALNSLNGVYKVRPNAFLMRVFFDAKVDEIVSVLSGGPKVNMTDTIELLNKLSPLNAAKWANIKL
jgi:hypothetical protein